MLNVVIYMSDQSQAQDLVHVLLKEQLIVHASIDKDSNSYRLEQNAVVKSSHYVITAQTKGLLFSDIERLVKEQCGEEVPIFSMPVTLANASFDQQLRNFTRKI